MSSNFSIKSYPIPIPYGKIPENIQRSKNDLFPSSPRSPSFEFDYFSDQDENSNISNYEEYEDDSNSVSEISSNVETLHSENLFGMDMDIDENENVFTKTSLPPINQCIRSNNKITYLQFSQKSEKSEKSEKPE